MINFTNDPPSILFEVQFVEVLEQLQNYFDPSTQLHQQFLDPILFWLDKAAELLGEGSEINSVLNESFNTTHNEFPGFETGGGGFPVLDTAGSVTRPLNSDQLTTLAPMKLSGGLTQSGGRVNSDQLNQLVVTQ